MKLKEAEGQTGLDHPEYTHILRSFLYDEKAPGGMDLMPFNSKRLQRKQNMRKKSYLSTTTGTPEMGPLLPEMLQDRTGASAQTREDRRDQKPCKGLFAPCLHVSYARIQLVTIT